MFFDKFAVSLHRITKNVYMKKFGFLFLFLLVAYAASAQIIDNKRVNTTIEYIFSVGDTIKFFPVNPNYSGEYSTDYPCFYDMECLESGVKPKYRFAKNKKKLTPKEEIEGSYFYVKNICGYEFKKNNNLFFGAILERLSDHAQMCIAIPADMKKEPKESILHSWIVNEMSAGPFKKVVQTGVVIPFMPKRFIDEMDRLNGETLIYRKAYNKYDEDYFMLKAANGESKTDNFLSSSKETRIPTGSDIVAGKMSFIPLGTDLIYCQPFMSVTNPKDAYMYRIPVSYFAGNSNILYVIRGKTENLITRHFIEKKVYLTDLKENGPKMDSLIGRTYFFNANGFYYNQEKALVDKKTRYIDNPKTLYPLRDGYYKCVGFDWLPNPVNGLSYYDYYVIFEDSVGKRFHFPSSFTCKGFTGRTEKIVFTKVFETKESKEAELLKKTLSEQEKKRLEAKYGSDVGFAIWIGKCTEERYLSLCKKYGKKKAGWMARRIYEVGWTYNEFLEAKNPIVKFECVHTYENKYAYYEVYNYGGTYITFKNSVIVSISDYMDSDY